MPKLLLAIRTPFLPDSSGGTELSTLTLLQRLRKRGWRIEILCGLLTSSAYFRTLGTRRWEASGLLERNPLLRVRDSVDGFACWRVSGGLQGTRLFLNERLRRFQPDLVLGHFHQAIPLLRDAARKGCPSFFFVRNVEDLRAVSRFPASLRLLANSPFSAAAARRKHSGEIGVVLPLVDPSLYRARRGKRRCITLINPVPAKGVAVALEIARRLPDERFLFVKGKWGGANGCEDLLQPAGRPANVELWEHQEDMRRVYAVTDILLVPSQFQDPLPRVILEAHVNGIPVIASDAGGIPYALGKGGILVRPKEDPEPYVRALRRLRSDPALRARLADHALENSRRPEFAVETQVENFLRFVEPRLRNALT